MKPKVCLLRALIVNFQLLILYRILLFYDLSQLKNGVLHIVKQCGSFGFQQKLKDVHKMKSAVTPKFCQTLTEEPYWIRYDNSCTRKLRRYEHMHILYQPQWLTRQIQEIYLYMLVCCVGFCLGKYVDLGFRTLERRVTVQE